MIRFFASMTALMLFLVPAAAQDAAVEVPIETVGPNTPESDPARGAPDTNPGAQDCDDASDRRDPDCDFDPGDLPLQDRDGDDE